MADFDLDEFCPEYRQAFGDMLIRERFIYHNKEKSELFKRFGEKYCLIPEFWWQLIRMPHFKLNGLRAKGRSYVVNLPNKVNTANILQYYFLKFHGPESACNGKHIEYLKQDPEIKLKMLQTSSDFETTSKIVEEGLCFPHKNLIKFLKDYQKFGAQPVTEEIIKCLIKSLNLYRKFEAAGDDDDEWFECIKKLENEEAIIANIELRLGTNKEIWNYYFKFLKEQNYLEELLDLYLRYCRFFLSDEKMRKKYRKEVERIGKLQDIKVHVYWIDTIEWELDFGDFETARDLFVTAGISNKSTASKLKTREDFDNKLEEYRKKNIKKTATKRRLPSNKETTAKRRRVQSSGKILYFKESKSYSAFSIPSFMTTYIAQHASGSILSKLYQSSKYFFSKLSIPVCHRLVIQKYVQQRYFQQSLFLSNSKLRFLGDQKLILSNSLAICSRDDPKSKISSLIPHLYKCDASHISICSQTVTFEQLKFLVSSGKVKTFECYSTKFLDENGFPLTERQLKTLIESLGNELENFYVWRSDCPFHSRYY